MPATYAQVFRVPIPDGAGASVSVTDIRTRFLTTSLSRFEPAAPAVRIRGLYPESPVIVSPPRIYREIRYVDVLVFPFQADASRTRFHPSIKFVLTFNGGRTDSPAATKSSLNRLFAAPLQASAVRQSLPRLSVNWQPPAHTDQAYKIKIRKEGIYKLDYSFISANTTLPVDTLDPRNLRLFLKGNEIPMYVSGEQDGIFNNTDAIYFYGRGQTGENDTGVWQKGDFTDDNVYWLMIGTQNGARMSSRDGNPVSGYSVPANFTSTVHFEQNPVFFQFNSQPDNDLWLWINAYWIGGDSSQASQHHNVTIPSVSSDGSFQATLTFAYRGRTYDDINPDHHVSVKVNDNLVGTMTSDAYDPAEASFTFNQSLLNGPGTEPLKVTHSVSDPSLYGLSADAAHSDWFEVTYSRLFEAAGDELSFHVGAGDYQFQIPNFSSTAITALDVSSPDSPVRLVNATITSPSTSQIVFQDSIGSAADYEVQVPVSPAGSDVLADVPSNLSAIAADTNWILIAPQAWVSAAAVQDLKALRQSQGLNAQVVAVEDIYDEYNYGVFSPYAIKDFLRYVYNLSDPAQLQYVVLLGDAEYDYKDHAGDGDFDFVPTMMVADPGLGSSFFPYPFHSFDNYYGCFAGNDSIPEVEIGRIPARSLTDAVNALTKIKFYETGIVDHSWIGKTVFAADCQDAGEFEPEQDVNVSLVRPLPPHSVKKMYFAQPPWNCGTNDSNSNSLPDLVDEMNSGQAIVSYLGHGSFQQISFLNILQNSDIPNLTNSAKPSVVLNADCYTGAFYHSSIQVSLLESLMATQAGMVSGIGPGTFMFGFQESMIMGPFFSDVFGKDKVRRLGDLYQHITMDLEASGDDRLAQGMAALGDPASLLVIPAAQAPQNLQAAGSTCGSVDLTWDPPAAFSGTYNVFRGTSANGPFTQINGSPVSGLAYSDTPSAGTYYYYVAGVDTEGFEGVGSDVVSQFAAPGGLTILPGSLPDGKAGSVYSQNLSASGGAGPYTFSVVSGALPNVLTLTAGGLLSGTPVSQGVFSFAVRVVDASLCGTQSYTITIGPSCLFCDDFNDAVVSSSWTYNKGTWTEPAGFLQGVFAKKATAIATPIYAGCALCTVEGDLKIAGGGMVYLLGWYQSGKNHVELRMSANNDFFMLKQYGNGTTKKKKIEFAVNPNVSYHAKIVFDGANFNVYIDNTLIITLSKIGATNPSGTVGFLIKSATGSFDSISVN